MTSPWKKIIARSKAYEEVVEACRYILYKDAVAADARAYLDSRLPRTTQAKYQFGFFPSNTDLQQLYSLGISKSILDKLLLTYPKYAAGSKKTHCHFNNHNLIMPFRDMYGNIISLLGRTLVSDEKQKELGLQKYKYTINAKKELYVFGLNYSKEHIIKKNTVICVEGQFDHIALNEVGIYNSVAFGWANMSKYQFFNINRFTSNFILLLDNDDAGIKARKKIKAVYGDKANIIHAYVPKEYKDIDECLRKDKDKNLIIKWISNIPTNKERDG